MYQSKISPHPVIMPTLWIHRIDACDLLVDFDEAYDAYIFGSEILEEYKESVVKAWSDTNHFLIGQTNSLQFLIEDDDFVPKEGWESWTDRGVAWVSEDEARLLGEYDEPDGFTPGESSIPWVRNVMTREDLDDEIDSYMKEYREITQAFTSVIF